MRDDIPTIAYWMGAPISEMSRDELEREFCKAHEEIAQLQQQLCNSSVAHIRDLAAMRRAEYERHKPLSHRFFDRVLG